MTRVNRDSQLQPGGEDRYQQFVERLSHMGEWGYKLAYVVQRQAEGARNSEIGQELHLSRDRIHDMEQEAKIVLRRLLHRGTVELPRFGPEAINRQEVFSYFQGQFVELLGKLRVKGEWGIRLASILSQRADGVPINQIAREIQVSRHHVIGLETQGLQVLEGLMWGEEINPLWNLYHWPRILERYGDRFDGLLLQLETYGEREKRIAQVLRLRAQGKTFRDIADEFGYKSNESVRRWESLGLQAVERLDRGEELEKSRYIGRSISGAVLTFMEQVGEEQFWGLVEQLQQYGSRGNRLAEIVTFRVGRMKIVDVAKELSLSESRTNNLESEALAALEKLRHHEEPFLRT